MATRLMPSIGAILLHHRVGTMPSKKVDLLTLDSGDTVHIEFLSVAMILCDKMDFNFGVNMVSFCRDSHIYSHSCRYVCT